MSSNIVPFGLTKGQFLRTIKTLFPVETFKPRQSDACNTLALVPPWVFQSPEWGAEYERLKVSHSMWWRYVPGFNSQPSDEQTKAIAARNAIQQLAEYHQSEAQALESQWRFIDNALKSNDGLFL